MKDAEGRELKAGDVIAYGARQGNSSKLRIGTVEEVGTKGLRVKWDKATDGGHCPTRSTLSKAACIYRVGHPDVQDELEAIYRGLGEVLCRQNYWTADEVNEAVSVFLQANRARHQTG